MTDLHFRPGAALAKSLAAKEIGAAELLEHFIARMEEHNPALNAIVATALDAARKRARDADEALAKGESWGPLHGLPMTIKDAYEVAGMPATGGSPALEKHVPATNAVAIQRLIDKGAVIFGKTNVPLFSGDLQSYNDVYGTTNNPWDLSRVPGGSSGGSAAAVAAGLTAAEFGSDIGGSIRTPAHFCGIYGHKTSYGIVPSQGHIPPLPGAVSSYDLGVFGPLARSADDLELLLDIAAGPDALEAAGLRLELPKLAKTEPQGLKVALWLDDDFCKVDAESKHLMEKAAEALADAGADVVEARPDFSLEQSTEIYLTLLFAVLTETVPDPIRERWRTMVADLKPGDISHQALQARGGTLSHADWLGWNEKRAALRLKWADFFKTYDVLLCPVALTPAFPHDHNPDFHARRLTVNGEERPYFDLVIWAGLPLLCYLPATAVPVGLTEAGLPVGMQIVANYLHDRTSIAVAKMLEERHQSFVPPPGF